MYNNDMSIRNFSIVTGQILPDYQCHVHPTPEFFELQLVGSADLYWKLGQRSMLLQGNWFWVNWPDVQVRYGQNRSTHYWDHRYMVLTGGRCLEWHELGLLLQEPVQLSDRLFVEATRLFDRALSSYQSPRLLAEHWAANQLEEMLLRIRESAVDHPGRPEWVDVVADRLADWHAAAPDYEALGAELGVSSRTLQRQFKKWTGVSPHTFYLQSRVERAKTLLLRTDSPLRTIADELGFSDEYYFNRIFSRFTGMPPGKFRKTMPPIVEL